MTRGTQVNVVYSAKVSAKRNILKKMIRNWQLYIAIALPVIYVIIFRYVPMYGAQIAFKKYIITKGIMGSPWIGFGNFERFFNSIEFWRLIKNTLSLSLYSLVAGFPFPILLALALNYAGGKTFKKTVQMVTYAPHFISTVVIVGMIQQFLSPRLGIVSNVFNYITGQNINLLGKAEYFQTIYVWSGIWQGAGYGSIIYLAALASIDPQLHEAAIVDGATKLQRIWNVDIPGIIPTAVIMLILNMGHIFDVGFEKVLLMQNPLNLRTSEVIETFVYKVGLASDIANYSYPTAVGLFKSVIGLILVYTVNKLAKKLSETSLW